MIPKQLSCREFYLNFKRSFELLGRPLPSTFVSNFISILKNLKNGNCQKFV